MTSENQFETRPRRRAAELEPQPYGIAADSRYRLTVNGERVQWEPTPSDPRWPQLHIRNAARDVEIRQVGVRRRVYAWAQQPHFDCSDPLFKQLFAAGLRGPLGGARHGRAIGFPDGDTGRSFRIDRVGAGPKPETRLSFI